MKQLCAATFTVFALVARLAAQGPAPAAPPEIVGEWSFTTVSPIGEQTNNMVVSKDGDALKAVAKSEQGEAPYDKVELTGTSVKIVLTINYEGTPMIITYTGALDGKSMSGAADFGGLAEGTWSAVRK